jgi:prepilin-type N-terminal cleavage/methylation domain-containing protein/prepilin-type processing-associated H-X9-DG protein
MPITSGGKGVRQRGPAKGFTLIELLVVIAIIGILISLLLPAVQKVREAANRTKCANNMKQIALACINYETSHGALPPATVGPPSGTQDFATWAVLILPFIEQDNLYHRWDLGDIYAKQDPAMVKSPVSLFFCPTRGQPRISARGQESQYGLVADYLGCGGYGTDSDTSDPAHRGVIIDASSYVIENGKWVSCQGRVTMGNIPDGTSNTFMLGEKHITPAALQQTLDYGDGSVYDHYYGRYSTRCAGPIYPLRGQYDSCGGNPAQCYRGFGSWHSGICQFAFVDGHVQALNNSTSTDVLYLLAVRDDGMPIPPY